MSSDLRRELRARKKAMRRSVAAMRKQARAKIDANPLVRRERTRRRIRRLSTVAALLLLMLFLRCECAEAPAPAPPPPAPVVVEKPPEKKPKPVTKPKPPLQGNLDAQPRGQLPTQAPIAPPWLEEFRIQVAARSPRLAECFTGVEKPGALRWSVAVNASAGTVSGHELEPLGRGGAMTEKQRDCVLAALSNPKYLLSTWEAEDGKKALPSRVSIVIEF